VNEDRLLTAAEVAEVPALGHGEDRSRIWDEVLAFDIVEADEPEDAATEDDER
jgi:hypothetical protein